MKKLVPESIDDYINESTNIDSDVVNSKDYDPTRQYGRQLSKKEIEQQNKPKHCKLCGKDVTKSHHGKYRKSNFLKKGKWDYYCDDCIRKAS